MYKVSHYVHTHASAIVVAMPCALVLGEDYARGWYHMRPDSHRHGKQKLGGYLPSFSNASVLH